MMRIQRNNNNHATDHNSSMRAAIALLTILLFMIILITFVFSPLSTTGSIATSTTTSRMAPVDIQESVDVYPIKDDASTRAKSIDSVNIVSGSVLNIPYYYCTSSDEDRSDHKSTSDQQYLDLVLLHGSAFTKEDWKTSNILQMFCGDNMVSKNKGGTKNEIVTIRVLALDLPVTAKHRQLIDILAEASSSLLIQLPISAIITPSASGMTIIDWFTSTTSLLQIYVHTWIPIASNGILKVPTDTIRNRFNDGFSILAIYGSLDDTGKRSSNILQTYANATVVELYGRHPCYFDSPSEFVKTVLTYVMSCNTHPNPRYR